MFDRYGGFNFRNRIDAYSKTVIRNHMISVYETWYSNNRILLSFRTDSTSM